MELKFLPIQMEHAPEIAKIYNYYILNSVSNFYTEPLSEDEILQSIPFENSYYPCYTIFTENNIIGFAYCTHFKPRQAYKHTAEITIYLSPEFTLKGIGKQVLEFIHLQARNSGIKELLAVITAKNNASIQMFSKFGYKSAGFLKQVGNKNGELLDVTIYQYSL